MEQMRHLAHFAEDVAENGTEPDLRAETISTAKDPATALRSSLKRLQQARERHSKLNENPETAKHAGLALNLDLTLKQELFQEGEISDWLRKY